MKILWLSTTPGLCMDKQSKTYGGGGWIESLERLVIDSGECELALAYIYPEKKSKSVLNNVTYYPIYVKEPGALAKMRTYYGGYKHHDDTNLLAGIKSVIGDFKPDLIHLFGIENPMAVILDNTEIPVVVHLQGILSAVDNAFYPPGFSGFSFLWPISLSEWIIRNGFIYNKKLIRMKGEREKQLLKRVKYCMGRTEWDRRLSRLLAPESVYFTVDEVLRQPFYEHCGSWKPRQGKPRILSTISDVAYKGLDLILKTADYLKRNQSIDFEWIIIGISSDSHIARVFEHELGINASEANVRYMGVRKPDEIVGMMLDSSIFVHPSYTDNSPNSVCEAQMLGLPVIACRVGGVPTLVDDGRTGYLVPANDLYLLSYQIMEILRSAESLKKLSAAESLSASDRHNKKKIFIDLFDAYNRILLDGR